MIVLYGIKNCDTCRKALKQLKESGREHRFHDLRADGLEEADLDRWLAQAGWEKLLNRRGTTWRNLPEAEKQGVDADRARALMLDNPTLIKRPVIDTGDALIVGFAKAEQAQLGL